MRVNIFCLAAMKHRQDYWLIFFTTSRFYFSNWIICRFFSIQLTHVTWRKSDPNDWDMWIDPTWLEYCYVCVSVSMRMHMWLCVCSYVGLCARVCACGCLCMRAYVHSCVYARVYIRMCVCACVCIHGALALGFQYIICNKFFALNITHYTVSTAQYGSYMYVLFQKKEEKQQEQTAMLPWYIWFTGNRHGVVTWKQLNFEAFILVLLGCQKC